MPVELKGGVKLMAAMRKFAPVLKKQLRKELKQITSGVVNKAQAFAPSEAPLSGWDVAAGGTGKFPKYDGRAVDLGIKFTDAQTKTNPQGFTSLARIINKSPAGMIYEIAGRIHPDGRKAAPMQTVRLKGHPNFGKTFRSGDKNQSNSNNPHAGEQFMTALNNESQLVDANTRQAGQRGRSSRRMKGRLIFKAWAQDQGKLTPQVVKAIVNAANELELQIKNVKL